MGGPGRGMAGMSPYRKARKNNEEIQPGLTDLLGSGGSLDDVEKDKTKFIRRDKRRHAWMVRTIRIFQ